MKEYDCYAKLIFEDEYSQGERNEKGKEFYKDDKLKFNGEYIYGGKWNSDKYNEKNNKYELKNVRGFTKEYNFLNCLISEYEYLFGAINGKRKEYYSNSSLMT